MQTGRKPAPRRFLDANVRLSARVAPRLESEEAFYRHYDELVAEAVASLSDGSLVVDLGGGKGCSFAHLVEPSGGTRIVAVDRSAVELAENRDVEETRVADVAVALPFADHEVDLLVSRTLLEHVDGVPAAVREMARVLCPGATTLHLFPCRWALFAMVARWMPFNLAKRIAHSLNPELEGVVEFEVVYDHCDPAAIERTFRAAGFRQVEVEVCWAQAAYVTSFFPAYLLVGAYQEVIRRLRVKKLAAYAIVRASL